MAKKHIQQRESRPFAQYPLSYFACPNPDCPNFNRFGADNLSIAEPMGKDRAISRPCKAGAKLLGVVCDEPVLCHFDHLAGADILQGARRGRGCFEEFGEVKFFKIFVWTRHSGILVY